MPPEITSWRGLVYLRVVGHFVHPRAGLSHKNHHLSKESSSFPTEESSFTYKTDLAEAADAAVDEVWVDGFELLISRIAKQMAIFQYKIIVFQGQFSIISSFFRGNSPLSLHFQ